jgi:hypothetical protein
MNKRVTAVLAIAGVAAAAGIGLAANEVTGDSVGLSADPLKAGDSLAPPAGGRGEALPSRERTSDRKRRAAGQDPPAAAPIPQPVAPTAEPGDDNGGDRSGPDDNSGSGSDDSGGSGSGSDDDSSGPGSGSDDD